jgi:ribosome-binding protein aMBF1 (putative translation factor)
MSILKYLPDVRLILQFNGDEMKFKFNSLENQANSADSLCQELQKLGFSPETENQESVAWKDLAKDRIEKHSKAGLMLRGARFREGLSQKKLAELSSISQENISRMENGRRKIGKKTAEKLAVVLKINPSLLYEDEM